MENRIIDAMKVAKQLIGDYLAVKPNEEVFIVVDPETDMTMPRALADYEEVCREGQILAKFWEERRKIEITSPAGTSITADIDYLRPIIECGIARKPGESMAFSDGEVSQCPNEGSMDGMLFIEGPITHLQPPGKPVFMTVENGRVVFVDGSDLEIVNRLRQIINGVTNANNIAEIGLGLNPASLLNGDIQEEKKARGTCHIALGDNLYFDGTVKCDVHIDMVMYKPTVVMDDIVVVEGGEVVMENLS